MNNIQELKEQLKKGTFYYHKFGLLVKGKVNIVLQNSETTLNVSFVGGIVDVYMDKIKLIRRPGNIIASFKWCYQLKNEYDDLIGYIGKVEE
ncbi:hypothetical protein EXM65_09055 [Clostridium botulinum]|uniref:Uncharacterized protein n=1 Tax=Clostridium botulinum TaxID=1491 RepID=A0A6M0SQR9_CLOBO|nr:hypothetical protein [Clostridium botulinum]